MSRGSDKFSEMKTPWNKRRRWRRGSACPPHLLPDNSAQRVLEFRRLVFDVRAQGLIHERLITDGAAGRIGFLEKMVDQIFVNADGDADFAFVLRLRGENAPAPALAEVILLFHRPSSYCRRSRGSATRAEIRRISSPQ